MKRMILVVPPAQRAIVEATLGALLGDGWGAGCLSPWPQPASAAAPHERPPATAYLCDAHLDDGAADKLAQLAVADTSVTLATALAVSERVPAAPRKTLHETLAEHEAKGAPGGGRR